MTFTPFVVLLMGLLPLILTEEESEFVHPNHRYFGIPTITGTQQSPRTLQQSVLNHLSQKPLPQHSAPQKYPNFRPKNLTFPQPSRLGFMKRSGDYHYVNMDYPQYETDDHGMPHSHLLPILRTMPYPRYPMYDKPTSRVDLSSIGIIALLKLFFLKIMTFGVFKVMILLLLKIPVILFILGFKFLIILKLIKLVKLLTIPILIPFFLISIAPILIIAFFLLLPFLLPLILAPLIPLILIPILLPLLLSLPVPVLAPTTTTTTGRRRRQASDLQSRSVQDDVLYLIRRVLESEQCIERVACQLAANKQSQGYTPFVAWYLEKAAGYMNKPRFSSYKDAYKRGMVSGITPQHCMRLYPCHNPRKAL